MPVPVPAFSLYHCGAALHEERDVYFYCPALKLNKRTCVPSLALENDRSLAFWGDVAFGLFCAFIALLSL